MIKKLTLGSSFNEIEKVEPFLNDLKDAIDEETFSNIQLAVNEAVTNGIIHGNEEDASKKVRLTVQITDEEVKVTVEDEGSGFDPANLPDPTDQEQLLKEGGRGVFLIKQFSDEVSFADKGSTVQMIFLK